MSIGERIKEIRERNGDSQEALAQKIGVKTKATISDIEKGKVKASPDVIIAISKLYNVSADWLLTGKDKDNNHIAEPAPKYLVNKSWESNFTIARMNFYKVIKHVNAGDPMFIYSEDNYTGEMAPFEYEKKDRCFALLVNGDSMFSPTGKSLNDGDKVLVDMDAQILPGDVVVVSLTNGRELIKQYLLADEEGYKRFHSFNSRYPDLVVRETEIQALYRVVSSISVIPW